MNNINLREKSAIDTVKFILKYNIKNIIFCMVTIILAFIATKTLKKFIDIAFEKYNIKNPALADILKKTIKYTIIFVTITLILKKFNVQHIKFCMVTIILAFITTKTLKKFIDIAFEKYNIKNPALADILKKTIKYAIILITVILISNKFNIPLTGINFA